MKILLCDGVSIWLVARPLHQGRFFCSTLRSVDPVAFYELQLQAPDRGALAKCRRELRHRSIINNTAPEDTTARALEKYAIRSTEPACCESEG